MKSINKVFVLFFIGMLLCACDNNISANKNSRDDLTIILQPMGKISSNDINYVKSRLEKVYKNVVVQSPISMPTSCYYPARNRYRADKLIRYLSDRTSQKFVTVGLTTKDISHTKGDIEDYGIMGLGFMPGNSCVASTFRLSPKNRLEQFLKLTLHEIAHTQGLPHCEELTCFMRDCGGKNHWDEQVAFCSKCTSYLNKKGWNIELKKSNSIN
jgi:archaemetzincin